ncbi:hypothetical protein [Streptomyces sp. NPDC001927]
MWKIEPSRTGMPLLHRGDCATYGEYTDLLTREQVMAAGCSQRCAMPRTPSGWKPSARCISCSVAATAGV